LWINNDDCGSCRIHLVSIEMKSKLEKRMDTYIKKHNLSFTGVKQLTIEQLIKKQDRIRTEISFLHQKLEIIHQQINRKEIDNGIKQWKRTNKIKKANQPKCDCLTHEKGVVAVARDCPFHGW